MSYNVDTWKTKELCNLRIPVVSLFSSDRKDWHPEREDHGDGTVTFTIAEDCEVRGKIEGDTLAVSAIKARGEGSGSALHLVIEPSLASSRGRLVAVRVWEGGDFIDRLTVVDGAVSSEPIEL